tara:strand:+ start:8945 stop:9220 length:276 start_codon:yes stop_codon:yes gene_type:complete
MNTSGKSGKLIEFPCKFPIKVLGKDCKRFYKSVSLVMHSHSQNFSEEKVKKNKSKKGKYISLTCIVDVNNQNELDEIYIDLSQNQNILFVL